MFGRNVLVLVILLASVNGFAQKISLQKKGNDYIFSNGRSQKKISFCTPSMFRVQQKGSAGYAPDEGWMVVQYQWAPVAVQTASGNTTYTLQTADLQLSVNRELQLEVKDSKGKLLSTEWVASGGNFNRNDTVGCTKLLQADEHFFGFGERMDFLDRRGKRLQLNVGRGKGRPHEVGAYNILEANYAPVPFFMSTNGYGIFFHTAYPTAWDMGNTTADRYSFMASGGAVDYYFIHGPRFTNILQQYTALTGRSPLLPRFAYGLHFGTYSGGTWGFEKSTSDQYVINLARRLRELGIPVDIIWLDSTWRIFGDVGGKGATSFEWRETFTNPKGMFDSLYAMNYNLVGLHLRPRFDNGKKIRLLDTAQALGFTYREGKEAGEFVNFFDSASVNFWWQHGVKRVADLGARFLKTDEGSAFGGLANESNKTGPQGKDIAQLHNLFPIAYARAPYEKFQQFNGMRGLNQTREGYAGIQRYPYIFAGDWPSEWQYFAPVIKAGLNIGLSGVGHWAHCMGGFEHVADPELYIRWVQFGMFSPVALVFGMDHPGYKEPWNYGNDALRNFSHYDSLRYKLLPYIYSNAYHQYKTGEPLMRALVLDYQRDHNVYEIGDQYLFGQNLMVCPVTTKGALTRSVYLPEGNWYNWWTGKPYNGKQYIHVVTPLDTMPIFVKAGSIIPMTKAARYVGEHSEEEITLDVFPGSNGSFDLYEDDGRSLGYQKGEHQITRIQMTEKGQASEISMDEGKEGKHRYGLRLHTGKRPLSVSWNGKALAPDQYSFNSANNLLLVAPQTKVAGRQVFTIRYE